MFPSQLEFLRHILDECAYIQKAIKGKTQEEILDDETQTKAIIRSLEIIGEASKRVDEVIKVKYPHIDWREMAGMRDRLIHNYFGVDHDIVYNTIINDIPELHHEIARVLEIESE
ncbi:MAG: DUF86 domain-containing protein [Bacteroidetes bacterium]|nr:DUF86 domain-containing protein [Bacteroidota bacterium]